MYKKCMAYFKKHLCFYGIVSFVGGVGVGILLTYPLVGRHPVRWGVGLIALALAGKLYAMTAKK